MKMGSSLQTVILVSPQQQQFRGFFGGTVVQHLEIGGAAAGQVDSKGSAHTFDVPAGAVINGFGGRAGDTFDNLFFTYC